MQVLNLPFLNRWIDSPLKVFLIALSIIFCSGMPTQKIDAATTTTTKAVWYRYYDQKGVANISTSVTPNHIKFGYEALDHNMQVIKKNRAYDAQKDLSQSASRAAETKRKYEDEKLKKAYTNSRIAINRRDKHLASMRTQIQFLQDQLRQLNSDKSLFREEKNNLKRKRESIPARLEENIKNNQININNVQKNITLLKENYRNTRDEYIAIIARLEQIEKQK